MNGLKDLALGKRGIQAGGVLWIAVGIFLTLSLISYSIHDVPNSSRSPDEVLNWGGLIGAYLAYTAFTGIGYAAYGLPLVAWLWGISCFRLLAIKSTLYRSLGLLGIALLFSVGSGLPPYSVHIAFKLGGWLGTQVSTSVLIPYGGRVGSGIILGALFITTLILSTDLELRHIIQGARWIGGGLGQISRHIANVPRGFLNYLRSKRAAATLRVQETKAKAENDEVQENGVRLNEPAQETSPAIGSLPSIPAVSPTIGSSPPLEQEAEFDDIPQVVEQPLPKTLVKQPQPPSPVAEARSSKTKAANDTAALAKKVKRYKLPSIDIMDEIPSDQGKVDKEMLLENARVLEAAMRDFDVAGKVVEVSPGPVVTRYEVEPAPGVKVNRIVTLSDDLARVMSANGIRIQAPVPGKSVVGVEIANQEHETVYLRDILESKIFRKAESKLTVALGKTISGETYIADLAKMPHLLVAGATGAGKSVCINALISSLLFKATPEEVRLLMIDPKVVELTMYNDIPHLMVPVITEPKKASEALKWAVAEMEARYQKLAKLGVRNLADYNRKVKQIDQTEAIEDGLEPEKSMPFIVVFIDEFADLMLTAPADVETSLMSLAQKSRAVGIHIILATQRPSVNVITGVIKANFPSRIAFQVASKVDSRTILDVNGAERLLGRGDMLFLPGGQGEPLRIHGAFISGEETERLVESIKSNEYQAPEVAIFADHTDINPGQEGQDELFDEAVQIVLEFRQASTSFLQRRMKVGYSRAARLMDELENAGVVGPAEGAKPRTILIEAEPDPLVMEE
jgi:S-DNA-T family DNA segregation ATPase FtsK/SpoIIIE